MEASGRNQFKSISTHHPSLGAPWAGEQMEGGDNRQAAGADIAHSDRAPVARAGFQVKTETSNALAV